MFAITPNNLKSKLHFYVMKQNKNHSWAQAVPTEIVEANASLWGYTEWT